MKKIGNRLYMHRDYAFELDKPLLIDFVDAYVAFRGFSTTPFNCVRIKPIVNWHPEIAFQYSKDFDTADEPSVDYTLRYRFEGSKYVALKPLVHSNLIWHHKWMWVKPDYKGFDYEASKARSALWKPHVKKSELTKIGNKLYWESIKGRWENGY